MTRRSWSDAHGIHDNKNDYLLDEDKYVANRREFLCKQRSLCFHYDGSIEEMTNCDHCYRKIEDFEKHGVDVFVYQIFKSIVILVSFILVSFLFRKWIIWLFKM